MNKITLILLWTAKIIAVLIMLQTLYFKFTASPESVYIFTTVGLEPYGRIGIGVLELIASILIIVPATTYLGAGLALGLMIGALGMHFTILGIQVPSEGGQLDGGQLFMYALIVAICSAFILWVEREKVLNLVNKLLGKKA